MRPSTRKTFKSKQRFSDAKMRSLPLSVSALSGVDRRRVLLAEHDDFVDVKSPGCPPGPSTAVTPSPLSDLQLSSSSVAHGLMNPNVVYEFRLVQTGTISASTSGNLQSSVSVDPSTGSNSDWTALTSLFDEVRLHRSRITYTRVVLTGDGAQYGSLIAGYARSLTSSTVPGNYNSVAALPDSQAHSSHVGNSRANFSMSALSGNHLWAPIGTPSGTVDIGCTGAWWIFGSALTAGATRVMDYMVEMIIQLRSRA